MFKTEHLLDNGKCFYFISKALLVLEIIKSWFFRYSNVMTSSNALAWNTKHNLQNNLRSKESLVMKLGQFVYYKTKFFIKKLCEKCGLETSARPFLIFKEYFVKRNLRRSACWFGQILIVLLINSLLQKFHFTIEVVLHSLQTQKNLELVFRSQLL